MDEGVPRGDQVSVDVERLASLDRLTEMLGDPTVTGDHALAQLQEEVNLLRAHAALAEAQGDLTLSRQYHLIATEVAYLAGSLVGRG